MNYGIIPAALLVSFFLILLFSLSSRRPLSGLWIVVLLIFLATLGGQLWIRPFGPVYWGISWIPLIIVPLFFFFLIFALLPPLSAKRDEGKVEEGALIAMGTFFWIIMILLIVAVVAGYYRSAMVV